MARVEVRGEPKRSGPVVGPFEQVVELLEPGCPKASLGEQASPVVRHGIPNRPEEAAHPGCLVETFAEPQFDRIQLDRVRTAQVAAPVDELASGTPSGVVDTRKRPATTKRVEPGRTTKT